MKNKIYSILFILILIAPTTGTYLWLLHKKNSVRKQVNEHIKKGIDRDELVLLKFTKEETQEKLRWEHPREFEYKHQMYDIVESKTVGDSVYYWCWWDIAETLVKKRISDLGKFAMDTEAQKEKKRDYVNPWFKVNYIKESFKWTARAEESSESKFVIYINLYHSPDFPPPSPPPRLS
ncbi:MAG: hypothetical protein ACQERS_04840 [Bacteroidota bacterium]